VGCGANPGSLCIADIKTKRGISLARIVRLHPYQVLIRQSNCTWVIEAADALQCTEAVIEGTIFLHENHDMFRIQLGTAFLWIYCHCPLNGVGQYGTYSSNA
jgi:hypothetical protein